MTANPILTSLIKVQLDREVFCPACGQRLCNRHSHARTCDAMRERITSAIQDLDAICAKQTGFTSFQDLLDAKGNYFPSLRHNSPNCRFLADYYDDAQQSRNDPRRAYRS